MMATAIYEKRGEFLHLLPHSTLPEPLRSNLSQPIPISRNWYVCLCARLGQPFTQRLDNHADVPGATEAAFEWARFTPCFCEGQVSGVRAVYE